MLGALELRLGDERIHPAPRCLGPVRPAVTDRHGDRRDQGLADEGVVRGVEPLTLVTQTQYPGLGEEAVKILGRGELDKKLTVHAHKFSKTARERIESAGGTCQLIES